jgi:hypothetical protein
LLASTQPRSDAIGCPHADTDRAIDRAAQAFAVVAPGWPTNLIASHLNTLENNRLSDGMQYLR